MVFEVLSPGNRAGEMARKLQFYDRFGVEEYYIYDPDDNTLEGWTRDRGRLREVPEMNGWTSPRLGVRFELDDETLHLIRPDGAPFQSVPELYRDRDEQLRRAEAEFLRAEAERERAEAERGRTEAERRRAEEAERRAAALAEKLRALGIDPESA
ncbi:MAG: Uma2 family endonuclease [Isosphaeraceae bacterium]